MHFVYSFCRSPSLGTATTFLKSTRRCWKQRKSLCEWRKIPFTTKNAITVNLFSWQFGYLLGFIKALKKEIYEEFKATFLLNENNWVKFIAVHFSFLHNSFSWCCLHVRSTLMQSWCGESLDNALLRHERKGFCRFEDEFSGEFCQNNWKSWLWVFI